jgi:hypothetical protein
MKNKIISLTLYIVILHFALYALRLSEATASSNPQILRVSPVIIHVPLSPGKTYEHEITVENMTGKALPLRASLSDFQATGEEGGYIFQDSHTNPLLSWITLSDKNLLLNPKEKKKIIATITTPSKIPLGGYNGMLFFEVVPREITEATRVIPKIGVLILANVGVADPKAKKAEILNYTTGFLHETDQIPLLLRVKNISLHYFTAKPIVSISPLIKLDKNESQPIFLEEKIVFQGNVRRWEKNLTLQDAAPNIYKAHLMLSTGNGQFITEDRYFIMLPFMKLIPLTLFILLALFLYKKRKHLLKALKALYK